MTPSLMGAARFRLALQIASKPPDRVRFHRIGRDSDTVRVIAAGLN
jgi:hypothetical protein